MLAIVVPYYRFRFLAETLESLAAQTDKRFTVYVGDDASPENPEGLLAQFNGIFNWHYKRFDENLGAGSLARQWERCIGMTQDEQWLMILGDDDVLDPDCIAAFYAKADAIREKGIKVIRYSTRKIDADSNIISGVYRHPEIETAPDFLIRKYKERSRSSLSEYIFDRKTTIEKKFRDFPLAWHSDELAVLEFSDFGNILTLDAVVNVRVSDASISGKKDNMTVKYRATGLFYLELFKNIGRFSKPQQSIVFDNAEKVYLINKKSTGYLIKILSFYLIRLKLARIVRFLYDIVRTLSRKHNAGRQ